MSLKDLQVESHHNYNYVEFTLIRPGFKDLVPTVHCIVEDEGTQYLFILKINYRWKPSCCYYSRVIHAL